MVAGVNARMRRVLGADIVPARQFHAQAVLESKPPAKRKGRNRRRTPPETSAHPLDVHSQSSIVTYESPAELSGLAYRGALPPTVERWVCDESGTA